jgi:hypothetical protein
MPPSMCCDAATRTPDSTSSAVDSYYRPRPCVSPALDGRWVWGGGPEELAGGPDRLTRKRPEEQVSWWEGEGDPVAEGWHKDMDEERRLTHRPQAW